MIGSKTSGKQGWIALAGTWALLALAVPGLAQENFGRDPRDGRDVALGNDQQMDGRLGIEIPERHHLVVLVLDLGRALLRGDPAEDAGAGHGRRLVYNAERVDILRSARRRRTAWGPAPSASIGSARTAIT